MKMAHEQGIKVVMSTGRTQSISQKEIDDVGCVIIWYCQMVLL